MNEPFEHPSEVAAAVADIASLGSFSNDWVLLFTGIIARIPPMAARNHLPRHINTCPGCRSDIPAPTACMSCAAKRPTDINAPVGQWAHEKSAQPVFRLKHEYLARVVALEAMVEQAQKQSTGTASPYRAADRALPLSTPKQPQTAITESSQNHQPQQQQQEDKSQHHYYIQQDELLQPIASLIPQSSIPATPMRSALCAHLPHYNVCQGGGCE